MNEVSPESPSSPSRTGSESPQRSLSPWFFFVTILLVVLPTLVWQWPYERDRWALAAALQSREAGKAEEAYAQIAKIIDRNPQSLSPRLVRAQWYYDDNQLEESLADINQAVAVQNDNVILAVRSLTLQKMGRHREAIDDLLEVLSRTSINKPRLRAEALNGVAYARAVGNLELEEALKQIEEAEKIRPDEPHILDTQAFILFRLGELSDAERVMNRTMELYEPEFNERKEALAKSQRGAIAQRELKALQRNAAVLYYHRGLIREKLGAVAEAKEDFDQVQALGFTPGEDLY